MSNHRWSLLLVCFFVGFSAAASEALAFDPVSLGVRAGVPLTDVLPDDGDQPFTTDMQRFTIGPAIELGLPLGLGVEFDALYKRFEQMIPGETETESSTSWEFVLVGKYRPAFPLVRPYVEAGVSFNRLSDVVTAVRTLNAETRTGIVAGAGLEVSLPAVRIIPGIRYSHFGEEFSIPSTNLVDFHVGILF